MRTCFCSVMVSLLALAKEDPLWNFWNVSSIGAGGVHEEVILSLFSLSSDSEIMP